jgi:splicing factor 45
VWTGSSYFAAIASLRFQPTKRPQIAAQKAKAKAIASKFALPPTAKSATPPLPATEREPPVQDQASAPPPPPTKTTIADWTTVAADDENVNDFFAGEKRARGGRKKRKKNRAPEEVVQNWDDIYDPSRPNNYEDYKNSEEKIREVREWKDCLYAHRMRKRSPSAYTSDESQDRRPQMNSMANIVKVQKEMLTLVLGQFAPPAMSFAPPANLNNDPLPPPAPLASVPDNPSGEDAYARRMRMGHVQPFPPSGTVHQPPPPPPSPPRAQAPPGQIARAPVRYSLPPPPADIPATDAELEAALSQDKDEEAEATEASDVPRSSRPGQKGFAERFMSKYGWTQGSGLGAQGTGIINPLYAKADKRKKKSDAEGGGFVTPTATGKIMGGQKSTSGQQEAEGKFGAMSEVIKLDGMLNGMDLDEELRREEGGIMQEIGEECGDKYGKVERVYIANDGEIEMSDAGPPVFVKFVSQLSALRAVNALEARVFNGNAIAARFWPKEDFDSGVYT